MIFSICLFAGVMGRSLQRNSRLVSEKVSVSRKLADESLLLNYEKLARIYIDKNIELLNSITLDDSTSHYISTVMRMKTGQHCRIFNGVQGEFLARIDDVNDRKRAPVQINVVKKLRDILDECNIPFTLYFSPIKKPRLKILFEKATELGISNLIPVIAQNTNNPLEKIEIYRRQFIEGAEQSERMTVPVLHQPVQLSDLLKSIQISDSSNNPHNSCLLVCRERSIGYPSIIEALQSLRKSGILSTSSDDHIKDNITATLPIQSQSRILPNKKASNLSIKNPASYSSLGVMVGPEGGFTAVELEELAAYPNIIQFVSLGPNVLRSETAAIAALSCISIAVASSL